MEAKCDGRWEGYYVSGMVQGVLHSKEGGTQNQCRVDSVLPRMMPYDVENIECHSMYSLVLHIVSAHGIVSPLNL